MCLFVVSFSFGWKIHSVEVHSCSIKPDYFGQSEGESPKVILTLFLNNDCMKNTVYSTPSIVLSSNFFSHLQVMYPSHWLKHWRELALKWSPVELCQWLATSPMWPHFLYPFVSQLFIHHIVFVRLYALTSKLAAFCTVVLFSVHSAPLCPNEWMLCSSWEVWSRHQRWLHHRHCCVPFTASHFAHIIESWQNYLVVFGVVQRIENMMFFFPFSSWAQLHPSAWLCVWGL